MNATDNVQVTKVRITILNDERSKGHTLERGEAVPLNDTWWEFETTIPTEGKIIPEAFDLVGNRTKREG